MSRRHDASGALPGHCGAAYDEVGRSDPQGRDSLSAAERGAPGDLSRRTMADLVAAATRAPSMHNTQPWRFRFDSASQTIGLYADPARMLRVAIRLAARCISPAALRCLTSAWPPPWLAASRYSG